MFAVLGAACASLEPIPGEASYPPARLLDGGGRGEPPADIEDAAAILWLSPEMRAFLARHVDRESRRGDRLGQLLDGMVGEGLFELDYRAGHSRTASSTFARRTGNCLSFTLMFVAMARELGLDARFQLIELPPTWVREGNWVLLDDHINVVLKDVRFRGGQRRDHVVDFNIEDFRAEYPPRALSDDQALALYYNNRGVETMREGDDGRALAYFARAHELDPELGALWINVSTLYHRRGDTRRSQSALLHALQREPDNPAALSSLALLYRRMGREDWADAVEQRLVRLRDQDPYYFYQRSLAAFRKENLTRAEKLVNRAIRLKGQEHRFYFLRARIGYRQGETDKASADLERARRLAPTPGSRERYASKLDRLEQEMDLRPPPAS